MQVRWVVGGVAAVAMAMAAACGGKRPPPPAAPAPQPPPPADAGAPLVLDRTIPGSPSAFRLRAAELQNLVYQLDCIAGTTQCSRTAYEELWTKTLGGLDEKDRAALARWKTLRSRYQGRIDRGDEVVDIGLPVPRPGRRIESRLRLAGYVATTPAQYAANLALFADPADVVETQAIHDRFAPRFAKWWPSRTASLARAIDGYAKLLARADVSEALASTAKFYRVELPAGFVIDIDLIARPKHASPSSGEILGLHALVEVDEDELPEARFPVVAHEIFHAWLASAPYEPTAALVRRFSSSTDPEAIAAYGLLDEALAAARGNGLVSRVVQPDELAKRLAKPKGLYDDPFIDGVAKALLASFERHAPGTDSIFDEGFFTAYMSAVNAAFPGGLPPIAHLRPFACLYDKSMSTAYERLVEVSQSGQIVSDDELDAKHAGELLEGRGSWPLVLLVPFKKLDVIRTLSRDIDKATAAAVAKRARGKRPFVLFARRPSRADLFVFVAPDDAAMKGLVETFAAREVSFDVLSAPK